MATVLVIGASKGIGLETVKRAAAAGHTVRAFSRSATAMEFDHPAITKVDGDALDRDAVERALAGADAVVEALGVTPGVKMITERTHLFSDATRILVDAMKSAGVRRLICVTGLGAGNSRGKGGAFYNTVLFPVFLKRVYDDKDVQEWIIRNSGLDWVIARPGLLTHGAATGRYQVLCDPRTWRAGRISRADVADFVVKQVDSDTFLGETPLLIK